MRWPERVIFIVLVFAAALGGCMFVVAVYFGYQDLLKRERHIVWQSTCEVSVELAEQGQQFSARYICGEKGIIQQSIDHPGLVKLLRAQGTRLELTARTCSMNGLNKIECSPE